MNGVKYISNTDVWEAVVIEIAMVAWIGREGEQITPD